MPQYLGPALEISSISCVSVLTFALTSLMHWGSRGRAAARQARKARRLALYWVVLAAGASLLGVYGWVIYRLMHPSVLAESAVPDPHLLPLRELAWEGSDGVRIAGWFVNGQRGAPLVVLCPAYGSNRSSVLNLASALREGGYNVLLVALRGHPGSPGISTLGWREADDLNAGITAALARENVDALRVGAWGATSGAFAVLRAAVKSDKIAAMALDSVYGNVEYFAGHQTKELLGWSAPWVRRGLGLGLSRFWGAGAAELRTDVPVERLFHIASLFLYGLEDAGLDAETRRLFALARGRRDLIVLPRGRNSILLGDEVRNYDSKILDFFRRMLPI